MFSIVSAFFTSLSLSGFRAPHSRIFSRHPTWPSLATRWSAVSQFSSICEHGAPLCNNSSTMWDSFKMAARWSGLWKGQHDMSNERIGSGRNSLSRGVRHSKLFLTKFIATTTCKTVYSCTSKKKTNKIYVSNSNTKLYMKTCNFQSGRGPHSKLGPRKEQLPLDANKIPHA